MNVLKEYEIESGQKVNMDKSFFYMYQNAPMEEVQRVEQVLGMNKDTFSLKYLGCPLSHSKKKKEHFAALIKKVQSKL